MPKNASRDSVKAKLRESIDYCNSHHLPVQPLFESLVDELITERTCRYDPEFRVTEMKALFPILFQERARGMIPSIPLPESAISLASDEFLRLWLSKWVQKFLAEWKSLPGDHQADSKRTVTDPALLQMVMASSHAGDLDTAMVWAAHHNLYMSAENAGGNLLEEYIANKIAPYGWVWCRGKIITAVDFCNDACTAMFQVKNKTNTENSSGKGFREVVGVQVWCRMRAERRAGQIETYWPKLVEIVRSGATRGGAVPDDLMTEDDYLAFVRAVSENNPYLISAEEN